MARALDAIGAVAGARPGQRLLVVSHGGVIHALVRHTGVESGEWQRLDNLEGRWFDHDDGVLQATGSGLHLLDTETDAPDGEGYA